MPQRHQGRKIRECPSCHRGNAMTSHPETGRFCRYCGWDTTTTTSTRKTTMSIHENAAKIAAEAIEGRWADEGLRLEELSDPEADAWTAIVALTDAGYRITFTEEGDR